MQTVRNRRSFETFFPFWIIPYVATTPENRATAGFFLCLWISHFIDYRFLFGTRISWEASFSHSFGEIVFLLRNSFFFQFFDFYLLLVKESDRFGPAKFPSVLESSYISIMFACIIREARWLLQNALHFVLVLIRNSCCAPGRVCLCRNSRWSLTVIFFSRFSEIHLDQFSR